MFSRPPACRAAPLLSSLVSHALPAPALPLPARQLSPSTAQRALLLDAAAGGAAAASREPLCELLLAALGRTHAPPAPEGGCAAPWRLWEAVSLLVAAFSLVGLREGGEGGRGLSDAQEGRLRASLLQVSATGRRAPRLRQRRLALSPPAHAT